MNIRISIQIVLLLVTYLGRLVSLNWKYNKIVMRSQVQISVLKLLLFYHQDYNKHESNKVLITHKKAFQKSSVPVTT